MMRTETAQVRLHIRTSVPGDADRDFPIVDEILHRGSVSDRPSEAAQHQVQAGGRRRLD